ncbi:MAG: hypothetical protein WC455_01900 [Dehalococcoidia bacterium]|jgi:hypothetical protein
MTAQKKGSMTIQEKLDRQKGINPPAISATAQFSERRRKMIINDRHRAHTPSGIGQFSEVRRKQIIIGRHRDHLTSAQGALSERVRKNIVLIKR